MAIWTTDDIETVQDAIRTAVLSGFATLTLAGQTATRYTLTELRLLLAEMQKDVDGGVSADIAHFGLRFTKLVPPGCG